ncbi:MAG: HAD family hydrolase [bacterium]|nr:HAD family hydrolase [bacterium]
MQRAAVFLDRDGTINEEVGYLHTPDGLALIPGSADGVIRINQSGMAAVVITNQSGVARGFLDETALQAIHDRLKAELEKAGARVDAIYVCPHHPEGKIPQYTRLCDCRKPAAALVHQAALELGLDLAASYMVGDHINDIALAHGCGMRSVLVLTGHGEEERRSIGPTDRSVPNHVASNLEAAVDWILKDRLERFASRT